MQTKHTPVIMLTCDDQTHAVLIAKKLKVTDYLLKPFKPEKLVEVIKTYLE